MAQRYFALDSHYIDQKTFDALYGKAGETKALIFGFMRYLKRLPDRGTGS